MKIYIAGQVTGIPYESAIKIFEEGVYLVMKQGWLFVNPLDYVPMGADPCETMKICLPLLADHSCDGILLLENYIYSEGAKIELALARYCKKHVYTISDLT